MEYYSSFWTSKSVGDSQPFRSRSYHASNWSPHLDFRSSQDLIQTLTHCYAIEHVCLDCIPLAPAANWIFLDAFQYHIKCLSISVNKPSWLALTLCMAVYSIFTTWALRVEWCSAIIKGALKAQNLCYDEVLATEVDVYIEIQKILALGFILYNTIQNLSARASR